MRTIFHAWIEAGTEIDLVRRLEPHREVQLDTPFWQMVKATFGFEEEVYAEELLLYLLLTDYAHHLKEDVHNKSWASFTPHRLV